MPKGGFTMLYAASFFLLSLAGALALPLCCGFSLWWAIPLFLGFFALLHGLLVVYFWCFCGRQDMSRPLERQNRTAYRGTRVVADILCFYGGVRAKLIGAEKLPKSPFLLVGNHRSLFDPLLGMSLLRDYNLSYVSKPSNLKIPLVGDVAYAAGFLPIDRENDRKALKTILQAADYLKRGLCSMGIYPEGTRSRTGELLPFHAGSFKIAQRAGVPLAITVTRGTEKLGKRLLLRPTRVELEVLELLPAERVKAMSTQELAAYSRARIAAALGVEG